MIDKLRVARVMKINFEHSEVSFFIMQATRSLSSLSYCSFVFHKGPPSQKRGMVVTGLN